MPTFPSLYLVGDEPRHMAPMSPPHGIAQPAHEESHVDVPVAPNTPALDYHDLPFMPEILVGPSESEDLPDDRVSQILHHMAAQSQMMARFEARFGYVNRITIAFQ
ncbi:hypothetical protein U1Q18_010855 [Sarracenia purpurea var. burkii]